MSYERAREEKRKLRKLAEATQRHQVGAYYDTEKKRYIRTYVSGNSGKVKLYQKQSNKRIRQGFDMRKGAKYKRVYDIAWEIY